MNRSPTFAPLCVLKKRAFLRWSTASFNILSNMLLLRCAPAMRRNNVSSQEAFTLFIGNKGFSQVFGPGRIKHGRFHDIRHAYASLLVEQGKSLAYVKEQIGHHSIQITVDLYAHAWQRQGTSQPLIRRTTKRNLSATKGRKALLCNKESRGPRPVHALL